MGFVIHKYLGKSLKAPPQSKKSANDGTKPPKASKRGSLSSIYHNASSTPNEVSRRGSNDFVGVDLVIPDSAYARNSIVMSSSASFGSEDDFKPKALPTNSASHSKNRRRASLQATFQHRDAEDVLLARQRSFRRSSLQHDAVYRRGSEGGHQPRLQDPMSVVDDEEEDEDYHQVFLRRDDNWDTTDETAHRLRQENRWLQLELKRHKRKYNKLEGRLHGMRDQLAYTNASWFDQLYTAQTKHQEEVFQNQRQAEKAANAMLEQELEEWKQTLSQVVEATKDEPPVTTPVVTKEMEEELEQWKDKYAKAMREAERAHALEHEAMERDAMLEEAQRRIEFLEDEVEAQRGDQEDDEGPQEDYTSHPRQVALLQEQRADLEDRLQEVLLANSDLIREQAKLEQIQQKLEETETTLQETQTRTSREKQDLEQQVQDWMEQAGSDQATVRKLKAQLRQREVTRESLHAEYALRLERLETENYELKEQLKNKEEQWNHLNNMKQSTISHLRAEIGTLRNAAPGMLTSRSQHRGVASSFDRRSPARTRSMPAHKVVSKVPAVSTVKVPDMTLATEDSVDSSGNAAKPTRRDSTSREQETLEAAKREQKLTRQLQELTQTQDETKRKAAQREQELNKQLKDLSRTKDETQRKAVEREQELNQQLQELSEKQNAKEREATQREEKLSEQLKMLTLKQNATQEQAARREEKLNLQLQELKQAQGERHRQNSQREQKLSQQLQELEQMQGGEREQAAQREQKLTRQMKQLTHTKDETQRQLQEALEKIQELEAYTKRQEDLAEEERQRRAAVEEAVARAAAAQAEDDFHDVVSTQSLEHATEEELAERTASSVVLSQSLYERLEQERQRLRDRRNRLLSSN